MSFLIDLHTEKPIRSPEIAVRAEKQGFVTSDLWKSRKMGLAKGCAVIFCLEGEKVKLSL